MFKKLDAETVVVIAVCGVLLLSWDYIFGSAGLGWVTPPKQGAETVAERKVDSPAPSAAQTAPVIPISKPSEITPAIPVQSAAPGVKAELISISNGTLGLTIDPVSGSIGRIVLEKHLRSGVAAASLAESRLSIGGLPTVPNPLQVSLGDGWVVESAAATSESASKVVSTRILAKQDVRISVRQTFELVDAYILSCTVQLSNPGEAEIVLPQTVVWTGGMPPIYQFSGDSAISESHFIDICFPDGSKVESRSVAGPEAVSTSIIPAKWIAVSNKYFVSILMASGRPFDSEIIGSAGAKADNTEYFVGYAGGCFQNLCVKPGVETVFTVKQYVGPKVLTLVEAFDPNASAVMHLAWKIIDQVSQWFMAALVYLSKVAGGSFGWAIVLLTIIVRLLFWPVTHQANVSMKKMQKIQPMVKELREKFKDDPQAMNTRLMELYKREKVNPFGGCLPILIQIPIFIALYWTLDGTVELRHSSFLWATDLTKPDTVATILGIAINPFALSMTATMFFQQKLTPTPADPMQAKMMMMIPFIMLIFLYTLPSGLTLYWTVSQIIGIAQLLVNKYLDKLESAKPKTA